MIHLYTSRQYVKTGELWDGSPRTEPNEFRLLCSKEWIVESEYVSKGPYSAKRPKSVTSVRKHVTCPKCLDVLLPQAIAEVDQMKAAYEKTSGHKYGLYVPELSRESVLPPEEQNGPLVQTLPDTL